MEGLGGADNVTLEINYGGVFDKGKSGLEYKGGETLPSCEAEKETCTSKQPKSADGKRIKHVATKRISPRGKVAPSNAKDVTSKEKGLITTINNSGSIEKRPVAVAKVSNPRQKASSATSKGRSPIEKKGPFLQLKVQVQNKGFPLIVPKHKVQNRRSPLYQQKPNNNLLITLRMIGLILQSHGFPMLKEEEVELQAEAQGEVWATGRGRATRRGTGRERTTTNVFNILKEDNASTRGAISVVDVETVHFFSQTSVGSSISYKHQGIKDPYSPKMQFLRLWSVILCKGATEFKAKQFNSFFVNYAPKQ
ncbi:hypothetical protein Cgig2_016504 [Carnegiea gigantea]|uniref:Uncharacterized protein n=1 Tax=Carnegiea gigantea TaxID=171969 RepID=A0A9Q1GLF5_9CARY|nr:hypothetical protein Cgig2_016504 [Carnegiea gigantea]